MKGTASLVSFIYCDTQVEVRGCILDNSLIPAGDVLFAKLVVDVDSGYFGGDDDRKACSFTWTRALWGFGAMPLVTCPRRFGTPLGGRSYQGRGPFFRETSALSMCCGTQVGRCSRILRNNLIR